MDWRLLDYAKEAEETASGLHVFLSEIPQYSKDITADIAELFAISNALHVLHEDLALSRYGRYIKRISRDLETCLPSLGFTLDDVRSIFTKTKKKRRQAPGAFPGTPPYADIWEDALADLRAEGISLPIRLEMYRTYLQGMHDTLKGDEEDPEVDNARSRLSRLVKKQEPMDSYFNRLSVNHHGHVIAQTPMPRPPVIARPHVERFTTYPAYGHPAHPPQLIQPHSPVYGEIPFIPPAVPEVPQSPTFSNASSGAYSSQSNSSGGQPIHWGMKVFDGRHSSTPFQTLGQPTRCFGRDEPQAIELLENDGFLKVLELPLEATNVWVRLYWRPDDHRARVLFLTLNAHGERMRHCFPLTGLKILRAGSCLQLCRVNREDGQLDLWANLRFTLYERMVLLYCSLVAMKRQDNTPTPQGLEDYFGSGETEEFGGEIQDATYLHAFRIFCDSDSGCVRFEATPRRGQLKTIPIWTAFVTQYIGRRSWMKRVGNRTVQFRELHPYIFCEGYRLPKGPSGKFYQLTFTTPQDARQFMEVFHNIHIR